PDAATIANLVLVSTPRASLQFLDEPRCTFTGLDSDELTAKLGILQPRRLQQARQALQQRLFVALHFCNGELQKYRTAWRALHEIANSLEQHSGKLLVALRQIVTGTSQTLVPNAFD